MKKVNHPSLALGLVNISSLRGFKIWYKSIILALLSVISFVGNGQITNYNFVASTPTGASAYADITGGTTIVAAGTAAGAASTVRPIGFTFNYLGQNYTEFSANSSGLLKFNNTSLGAPYSTAVTTEGNNNPYPNNPTSNYNGARLYAWWELQATGTNGSVSYVLTGAAPNRVLTVQWNLTNNTSTSPGVNTKFQVKLYEGTNKIEYHYGTSTATGLTASIGMSGMSAAYEYLVVTPGAEVLSNKFYSDITTFPAGRKYEFTPKTITVQPSSSAFAPTFWLKANQGAASAVTYTMKGVTAANMSSNGTDWGTTTWKLSEGALSPTTTGAWLATAATGGQGTVGVYLQLNLGSVQSVDGIATRGGGTSGNWVTDYTVKVSADGTNWVNLGLFQGNEDASTINYSDFPTTQNIQYIRVYPAGYSGWRAMRVDAYTKTTTAATDGQKVRTWFDQSVADFDAYQPAAANQFTYRDNQINFNPALVSSNASNTWMQFPDLNNVRQGFWVAQDKTAAGGDYFHVVYGVGSAPYYHGGPTGQLYWTGAGITGSPTWRMDGASATAATAMNFGTNGHANQVTSQAYGSSPLKASQLSFQSGFTRSWEGPIAEVLFYQNNLTAAQVSEVETYLAIKYGITKGEYYVGGTAADGSAITTNLFPTTGNAPYNNAIFGIGRNDAWGLHQRQSRSVEPTAMLTIGNNNIIGATNASSVGNDIATDNSYLLVGDNNAALGWNPTTATFTGGANSTLARVWKAQETGTIGSVKLTFNANGTNGAPLSSPATKQVYLIVSNDATFDASDATTLATYDATSSTWSVNVDLTNGQYFTLATYTTAPGGVGAGMQHWLKADNAAITAATGAGVGTWPDATIYGRTMAVATGATSPTITRNALNFNPTIVFDAVTGAYTKTTAQGLHTFTSANTAGEVFSMVKGADNASRGYPFDYGTSGRGNHWLWSNNTIYDGFGSTARLGYVPTTKGITEAKTGATVINSFDPFDWGLYNVRSATNNWGINHNTNIIASTTTNTTNFTYSAGLGVEIGTHSGSKWKGWMPEVVEYGTVLSTTDRQKVNTYFGVKYAVPLTHNYISPAGTVLWDITANSAYNNNITSIGRSDIQELHQRQGQSWKNLGSLTIGNNNIINFTTGNTSTAGNDIATNESYLIVGDNNGAFSYNYAPSNNAYHTLNRVWKLNETGTIGSVKISIPGYSNTSSTNVLPNTATATTAANPKVYLVVDNDGNFNNGGSNLIEATAVGSGATLTYEVNVDLSNSTPYFTWAVTKNITNSETVGDNSVDMYDVDDDNDGVLDFVELNGMKPLMTVGSSNTTTKVITGKALAGPDTFDYSITVGGAGAASINAAGAPDGGNGIHFTFANNSTTQQPVTIAYTVNPVAGEQTGEKPYLHAIEFGPNVPFNSVAGSTSSNESHSFKFTWDGPGYGIVYDPNNQLSTHATGDYITSGDVITQNANVLVNAATWKVVFYPFDTNAAFTLNAELTPYTTTGSANEFFGFNLQTARYTDTDGDGLPNHNDTDSDGDGCTDAFETGVTGATASTTTVPGAYGVNGLSASVESSDALDATVNYTATYALALNADMNTCLDTDTDGVNNAVDIDDDNDGIIDADELACESGAFSIPTITSAADTPGYSQYKTSASAGIANAEVAVNFVGVSGALNNTTQVDISKGGFQYIITDNDPAYSQSIEVTPSSPTLMRRFTFGPNVVSNQIGATQPVGVQKITLDWNPLVKATIIDPNNQLVEADGATLLPGGTITTIAAQNVSAATWKIVFDLNGYNSNFVVKLNHRTTTAGVNFANQSWGMDIDMCASDDTDNDGIISSLDTDSDADGCPDAYEASATGATNTTTSLSGAVGANGLLNTLENNDTQDAVTTYANTNYLAYSIVSGCADTDSDGIPDKDDLDDDNDGILDVAEYSCAASMYVNSYVITSGVSAGAGGSFNNGDYKATGNFSFSNLSTALTNTTFTSDTYASNFKVNDANGAYSYKAVISPNTSTLSEVSFGPNLAGNTANAAVQNAAQSITLNWSLPIGAIVIDPDDQLSSHTDGQSLASGGVIITRAAQNASLATWKVIIPINFTNRTFTFTADFLNSAGYTTAFGDETWGLGAKLCNKTTDMDGDGKNNAVDTDSDGDGCSDLVESKSGKHASLTSLTISGAVGSNGIPDVVETNDTKAAAINYTLSLDFLKAEVKGCLDTDGDKIANEVDIDDDNDGVLDQIECPRPAPVSSYTWNRINSNQYKITANTGAHLATVTVTPVSNLTSTIDQIRLTDNSVSGSIYDQSSTNSANRTLQLKFEPGVDATSLDLQVLVKEGGNGPWWFHPRQLKLNGGAAGNGVVTGISQRYYLRENYQVGTAISPTSTITTRFNSALAPSTNKTFIDVKFAQHATAAAPMVITYNWTSLSGNLGGENWGFQILEMKVNTSEVNCDPDNDGKPNDLDDDSDADGCKDGYEANAAAQSTALPLTGAVGANGFVDALETVADNGVPVPNYTYPNAINSGINACVDFDHDGIADLMDIDDDNDGVLDAIESPSCFYTAAEWNTSARSTMMTVTSDLFALSPTNDFNKLTDNLTTAAIVFSTNPAQDQLNKEIFKMTFTRPTKIDAFYFAKTSATQIFGANVMLQGSNDNITWTNLQSAAANPANAANVTVQGSVSLANSNKISVATNAAAYKYYRVFGTVAGNIVAGSLSEIYFDVNTAAYQASNYPKAGTCLVDTDADSKPNHLDTDSDGDGCPDTRESGTITVGTTPTVAAPYGLNGFADALETAAESGVYKSTYTYATALDANVTRCDDFDGDGIPAIDDIDDDNDGITDLAECPSLVPFKVYTFNRTNDPNVAYNIPVQIQGAGSAINYLLDQRTAGTDLTTVNTFNGANTNWKLIASGVTSDANNKITVKMLPTVTTAGSYIFADAMLVTNGTQTIVIDDNDGFFSKTGTWTDQYNQTNGNYSIGMRYAGPASSQAFATLTATWTFEGIENPTTSCDEDGDGISNQLDLDSDGDGCSDAYEAGTTTDKTTNYSHPAPWGVNGLTDALETVVDNGRINYTSTYNTYAIEASKNLCDDKDGDGISDYVDIDDDNDGILDNIECPRYEDLYSCKINYPSNVVKNPGFETGNLTNWTTEYSGAPLGAPGIVRAPFAGYGGTYNSEAKCGGNYVMWTNVDQRNPSSNYDLVRQTVTVLPNTKYEMGLSAFEENAPSNFAIYINGQMKGNTGAVPNRTWTNYKWYYTTGPNETSLVLGVRDIANVSGGDDNAFDNVYMIPVDARPSCDTDGDGIPNDKDTDSDNDGCNDGVEGGSLRPGQSVPVAGPYGANGFADGLETTTESGIANFVNSYDKYAKTAVGYNYCLDSDRDGIVDEIDLDDDNDGVLDTVESTSCVETGMNVQGFTFNGVAVASKTATSLTTSKNAGWVSSYSDQTLSLPITLRFKSNPSAGKYAMLGLIPVAGTQTATNWTDQALKFYLNNGNVNGYFPSAWTFAQAQTAGEEYKITIDAAGKYSVWVNGVQKVNQVQGTVSDYKLAVSAYSTDGLTFNNVIITETDYALRTACTDIDTDGDGVPNRLDIDSDGDGCNDSVEGGAAAPGTASPLAGPFGANGLADSKELNAPESGVVNYTVLYDTYAKDKNKSFCLDSDRDGIVDIDDIDDDNDGVLDIEEQACISVQGNDKTATSLTSELTWTYNTAGGYTSLAGLLDGKDQSFNVAQSAAGSVNGKVYFEVTFGRPRMLTAIEVGYYPSQTNLTNGGTYVIEAFDGTNWVNVSSGTKTFVTMSPTTATNNSAKFDCFKNRTAYAKYRIKFVTATAVVGWVNEIYFEEAKCDDVDTDGDGIVNRLDLDSDGDGCNDSVEAGAAPIGFVAPFTGNFGPNGLIDTKEVGTETGKVTYTSVYDSYAKNSLKSLCKDTDGDGIADFVDVDDDNDGILDTVESNCPPVITGTATCTPSTFYYIQWDPYVAGSTTATGKINVNGTIVNVRLTNNTPTSSQGARNTAILNTGVAPYNDGTARGYVNSWCPAPPTALIPKIAIQSLTKGLHKFEFDQDIVNPRFFVTSLNRNMLLSEEAVMLKSNGAMGFADGAAVTYIQGAEGCATFNFDGNYKTVAFTGTEEEYYCNFSVGIAGINKPCTTVDTDGDGITDDLDLDSDGDGVLDVTEAGGTDANGDGRADGTVDANGLPSSAGPNGTTPQDTDGDGTPNWRDLDSDGDGIKDVTEASPNGANLDTNGDGKVDGTSSSTGIPNNANSGTGLTPVNTEGDLKSDITDLDSDGDGIPDKVESGCVAGATTCVPTDTDGDGIPDFRDTDSDNDGILDADEDSGCTSTSVTCTPTDSDGDGIPNYKDLDSDNDGILDSTENQACSPLVALCDTDGDGTPNYIDKDSDGDGITDVTEAGGADINGDGKLDGTPNQQGLVNGGSLTPPNTDGTGGSNPYDLDSDGDGILDSVESGCALNTTNCVPRDTDGDGIPDYKDLDSDNDGIPDQFEGTVDTDGDGTPDYRDLDSDGDGKLDATEDAVCTSVMPCAPTDTDGDGTPDFRDLDADNDGVLDAVDQCPTVAGTAEFNGCTNDADNDGVIDTLDLDDDNDGILDSVEAAACTPANPNCDTDGDGIPNRLDTDSDNDGISDVLEAGGTDANNDGKADGTVDANGIPASANGGLVLDATKDPDGDGKFNPYDVDSDGDGIPDSIEKGSGTTPVDTDGDGTPDYLDTDSDGDGIPDKIEGTTDTDGDGIPDYKDTDSDNDGILDAVEDSGCTGTAPCTPTDTDGDGIPNYKDLDSDGDNIADAVEKNCTPVSPATTCTPANADGDANPNYLDVDSDGDGIPDKNEGTTDTDGDGIPNYLDTDSDGDGIADAIEDSGCTGTVPCTPTDTDGDGVPNYMDTDSDGDGILDAVEKGCTPVSPATTCTPIDTDGDGTPDYLDLDSDGDGILDSIEKGPGSTPVDTDKDGTPDYRDLDADGDGILDSYEKGCTPVAPATTCTPIDTDGDGIPDFQDLDADNDGITDAVESAACTPSAGTCDTDNDGIPNFRDLDSDGDGIQDVIEGGGIDANGDGKADGADANGDGIPDSANNGLTPPNTDGTGGTNPYDVDSDGDGILDSIESGCDGSLPCIPVDTDGDGIPDYKDIDSDNDGILDSVEKGSGTTPVDSDGDGTPDFRDLDSDGDGLPDSKEGVVDTDGDGTPNYLDLDSDGDGILDANDTCPLLVGTVANNGCPTDFDGDGIDDVIDLDDDNDGILDTDEAAACSPADPDCDVDGDGIPNRYDYDSDGDGISDVTEAGGTDANQDGKADGTIDANGVPGSANGGLIAPNTDGDFRTNPYDVDSDGDGLTDNQEKGCTGTALTCVPVDTDGDGVPNYLDKDSDNDGIPDSVEKGTGTSPLDTDNDGIPDYLDIDSDNDGILDSVEDTACTSAMATCAPTDTDGDGVPDYRDLDSDGDGLTDNTERGCASTVSATACTPVDTDGDGTPDFKDLDSDGDGVADAIDQCVLIAGVAPTGCVAPNVTPPPVGPDSDNDGVVDSVDLDDDNDGILDSVEEAACSPAAATCDTDGDGIINSLDLDSDGDGITDVRESTNGTTLDANGDGKVDGGVDANGVPTNTNGGTNPVNTDGTGGTDPYDVDSDNDGIPDSVEKGCTTTTASPTCTPVDTDGDGTPDFRDTDSDNDGILDSAEKGTGTTPTDTDGDGIPDYLDTDADGDGIEDVVEGSADTDGDGIPNYLDIDSDGDGITDAVEKGCTPTAPATTCTPVDTDGDGTPDYKDLDSDGDGIPDAVEKGSGSTPVDTDGDNIPDYLDTDSDGDGILDAVEDAGCTGTAPCTPTDTDGDGIPDYRDLDSDGDGILDSVEKGCTPTAPATTCTPIDTDGDGVPNFQDLDSDGDGILDSVEKGCTPVAPATTCTPIDTDGDGTPNYLDLDSDADGIPDAIEKGSGPTPVDTDGDNIPDYLDTDSDGDGIPDNLEDAGCTGTSPCTPTDSDGDGIPNYRDLDSDNDGILDSVENAACNPAAALCDTDGDGTPNYIDLDSDNDGIKDLIEGLPSNANISTLDANGDGVLDGAVDANGVPSSANGGSNPPNTDGTGGSDPYDTDADGDGLIDSKEGIIDTDGDGTPNYRDLDSDGDGVIDDLDQCPLVVGTAGNNGCPADSDGDGIIDSIDLDDDNDGILDTVEDASACTPNATDCDGDGIPNRLDKDSDGDGINDLIEALPNGANYATLDANNDGKLDGAVDANGVPNSANGGLTPPNTDGTAGADPYDTDSDGDGISDNIEKGSGIYPVDSDGDGTPDFRDLDSDNDGIPDAIEGTVDTDGDGKPDYLDVDSDNDGILDSVEKGTAVTPTDTDGDGVPDFRDLDSDNDGILDSVEDAACNPASASCDTDGDGVPNRLDLDSDGDGISDVIEGGGTDANGDGKADGNVDANGVPGSANGGLTPPNTDGTAGTDPYDTDADGDGIPDSVEKGCTPVSPSTICTPIDTDGDGIPNYKDLDSDADGIPDATEGATNRDGDALPNYLDTDSDGDGIPDAIEGTVDTDGDGVPNYLDKDSDNDGILDSVEQAACNPAVTLCDTDGDGTPNYLDLDSDGDGIKDLIEAQPNNANIAALDANGDGKLDGAVDANGVPVSANGGVTPPNTDGVEGTDPYDTDADGDGIPDSIEKGTGATPKDTDGDGIPDYRDLDSDNDGVPDNTEKGSSLTPTDTDRDGVPDNLDLDSDNDGILDSVENAACTPTNPNCDTDGDGIPNRLDRDSDGDGIFDVIEGAGNGVVLDANNDGMVDGAVNANGVPLNANNGAGLTPPNTDGTAGSDPYDTDADGDGRLDSAESGLPRFRFFSTTPPALADADKDGIPDFRDTDSDGDGVTDAQEILDGTNPSNPCSYNPASQTTPATGWNTADCDGDGLTNAEELTGVDDPATPGVPNGTSNPMNEDTDGDGVSDLQEAIDGTNPNNSCDYNAAHQITPNVQWMTSDCDGDGVTNRQELLDGTNPLDPCDYKASSQNVANTSVAWKALDCDGDGTPNGTDTNPLDFCVGGVKGVVPVLDSPTYNKYFRNADCDGDGIPNHVETNGSGLPLDFDGDGLPNYMDGDSDNDGIPDQVEAGQNPRTPANSDSDGWANYQDLDSDNDGISDQEEGVADTDGDGIPNYLDLDSDGDGIKDAWEAIDVFTANRDENYDGQVDKNGQFIDNNQNGWADISEGQKAADTDGDGVPDYKDLDSDNDCIPDAVEKTSDLDKDNRPNYRDTDSDGDGIPDQVEAGNCSNPVDTDGDGMPDYLDADSDNDGIPDSIEAGANPSNPVDTDGDGTPDFRDLDSDNDGIPDKVEAGSNPATPVDTDGDGIPDYQDVDSDNDGIPDKVEAGSNPATPVDTDGDGIPDYQDVDSDNDGIPDKVEAGSNPVTPVDTDGDGTPDFRDLDSDNDGIPDAIEAGKDPKNPVDTDGDGTPDFRDLDSDNDGIPDAFEAGKDPKNPVDTDGDGTPDFRDLDSDNDGIPDAIEAGKDPKNPVDTDGDGIPDFRDLDSDNDGIIDAIEAGNDPKNPVDTDKDGTPDFRDLDSDNDGIPDKVEGNVDTDKDGIADFRDLDSDNDGISDVIEAGADPKNPVDTDGDGTPDFRDIDSDNDGILDQIEGAVDTDKDGTPDFRDLDSDNDGYLDKIEGNVDTDKDGTPDFRDLDSDGDAIPDKLENDIDFGGMPDCDGDGVDNRIDPDVCPTFATQGISPNNDGINDVLIIPGIKSYKNHLTIFNRWGNVVWEQENYQNNWGGETNQGDTVLSTDLKLPDGTYYYVIDFYGVKPNVGTYVYINRQAK